MPTGYTEKIKEGITFEEYAIRCARAFGALSRMRDEPMNTPLPDAIPPNPYYAESLTEARERLTKLESLADAEKQAKAADEWHSKLNRRDDYIKRNDDLIAKYNAMLEQVRAWQPPTKDHNGLKDFMISQITDSIRFDCSYTPEIPEPITIQQWYNDALIRAQREVANAQESYDQEVARCKEATEWINQLKQSLGI